MADEEHNQEIGTLRGIGRQHSEDWQRSLPRDISPEQWVSGAAITRRMPSSDPRS